MTKSSVEVKPANWQTESESEAAQYFTYLTGLVPTSDQVELLDAIIEWDRIEASAGRQSGKTIDVSVATMYLAYKYHIPLKILLLSAQENIVYWYMRSFFRGEHRDELTEDLIGSRSAQNVVPLTGFQLNTGTNVFVTGVTERNVRGFPADVVIIDEACLVPNDIIMTALGNLSGPVSKFILLSTPIPNPDKGTDKEPKFMKWLRDPEFKVFHWSSLGLPWHSQRLVDTKRKEFTPAKWAAEVLGRAPTEDEISLSGDIIGEVLFIEVPSPRRGQEVSTRK